MKPFYVLATLLLLSACATAKERYEPEEERDRSPERYEEQYVH